MGVVRRDGPWRFEKRDPGFYEITRNDRPEVQVLTPKYDPGMVGSTNPAIPTKEVDSYQEAEGLFEEYSQGDSGASQGTADSNGLGLDYDTGSNVGDVGDVGANTGTGFEGEPLAGEDLSIGMMALILLVIGGALLYAFGINFSETWSQIGIGAILIGLLIIGYAANVAREEGLSAAADLLSTTISGQNESTGSADEKTPSAPQRLKTKLKNERADRTCEFCNEQTDRLEVHHIIPRAEGGPNDPDNLIVLCLTCHDKAERGVYNRDELRYEIQDKSLSDN